MKPLTGDNRGHPVSDSDMKRYNMGEKEKPSRQADQSTREDATRRGTVIITRPSTKYKEEIT